MSFAPGQPPTRVILEQPGGWSRWSGRLAWIVAGLALLVAVVSAGANAEYFQTNPKVIEQYHSLAETATDKVAIVDISGPIMGGDGFVRHQIDQIEDDPSVRAMVLRIDSPGGTVSGSDELHYRIGKLARERDLPVVVSMGGIAASGGYYLAMTSGGRDDTIFAEPSTITGSIGVIIPHFDLSQFLKRFDITDDSFTSGPLKEMLSLTKDRSPELAEREREVIQGLVDAMFTRFKSIVKEGRPNIDDETLTKVTTGQVFTAHQAVEFGLVDQIGFLEDAVDRAVALAGLSATTARVVRYQQPRGLLDELVGGRATARTAGSLQTLVEWTTPRAWYLCTWWPAVAASHR